MRKLEMAKKQIRLGAFGRMKLPHKHSKGESKPCPTAWYNIYKNLDSMPIVGAERITTGECVGE